MSEPVPNRTPGPLRLAWQGAFLAALREAGVVRTACEAAGVGRRTVYDLRDRDPGFAAAWEDALEDAADLLEQEAVRRARVGVREPVIHQGRPCGVWVNEAGEVVADNTPGSRLVPLAVTKYSDGLLMFLLKGARPHRYRERPPELPPLEVLLAALPPDVAAVVREALARAVGGEPGGGVGGEGRLDAV